MTLWTWRPNWDAVGELQRQVERLFDFTADGARQAWQAWRQFPAFNLYETPTEYIVAAPLPGTNPEDVDVTVAGNTITLKGERKRSVSAPDEAYRRQERWLGKWSRSIQAPDKANLSHVTATLDNGMFIIHLPKVPESQARQVPVKVAAKPARASDGSVETAEKGSD